MCHRSHNFAAFLIIYRPLLSFRPFPRYAQGDRPGEGDARAYNAVLRGNVDMKAFKIAGAAVAKAPPDGYTLFVGSAAGLAGNLAIYQKMPYNPLTDFSPLAMLAYQANILIVNPSLPARKTSICGWLWPR